MRKAIAFLCLLLMIESCAFASIGNPSTTWDVRTTGSNTNGGFFDSGVTSPGTNESVGSGTAITITLASATTGSASPAFTSTTHGPGNGIYITGGTGCTTGQWYELKSQTAGVGTFDRPMGSATDVCTGLLGGSLASFSVLAGISSYASELGAIYVQTGAYSIGSSLIFNSALYFDSLTGYASTQGDDGTPPTITCTASPCMTTGGAYGAIQNMIFAGSGSPAIGIAANALAFMKIDQVTMSGFGKCFDGEDSTYGYWRSLLIARSNVTGCTTYVANNNGAAVVLIGDALPNNPGSGSGAVYNANPLIVLDMAMPGTGGSGAAINCNINYGLCIFDHVTITGSGGSNIQAGPSGSNGQFVLANSIIYGAGTYGLSTSAGLFGSDLLYNNAFGANSSGNQGGGGNTYVSYNQVNLTASPFVSSTNLALNSTAGGGAACKAAGYPGAILGGAWTGYFDIGGAQSQGSSSSGSPFGYVQ